MYAHVRIHAHTHSRMRTHIHSETLSFIYWRDLKRYLDDRFHFVPTKPEETRCILLLYLFPIKECEFNTVLLIEIKLKTQKFLTSHIFIFLWLFLFSIIFEIHCLIIFIFCQENIFPFFLSLLYFFFSGFCCFLLVYFFIFFVQFGLWGRQHQVLNLFCNTVIFYSTNWFVLYLTHLKASKSSNWVYWY